jgi:hypothetical protein
MSELPDKIRVSGLPFMLQGWNNVYTKRKRMDGDELVYELHGYMLYWFIHIIGVSVHYRGQSLVFHQGMRLDAPFRVSIRESPWRMAGRI